MSSNNLDKQLTVNRSDILITKYTISSHMLNTKCPKAGRANFQHQELTGKGNIDKMLKKHEYA